VKSNRFSKSRLDHMRDVLAGHVQPGRVAGMVSLVARDDEVHVEPIGAAAFGGRRVQRDTIFRIASMTKPVTAVATLMLIEDASSVLTIPSTSSSPSSRTGACCGASTARSTTPCPPNVRSRRAIS
jgi:hypothetical protein